MPNPKHRHSKSRGRLRRTFYRIESRNLSKCPQCSKPKLSHRICPFCGYYKGESRVTILSKDEKKKAREKKRTS
ncbi:MAG: 50S ribosomal protein L32 [Candidatus Omnitrophica bacterium]|nr:50S ribosomal protein L32 [Candidatus Omnitrophota bacterium]